MHILHQSRIVIVMAKRLYPSNFRHYAIMHEPTAVLSTAKHCGPINEKLAFVKLFAFCIIIIIIRDFNLILHAQALSKSKKRKKNWIQNIAWKILKSGNLFYFVCILLVVISNSLMWSNSYIWGMHFG